MAKTLTPLVFSDYLRHVPPSVIYTLLPGKTADKRGIISASMLADAAQALREHDSITGRFLALSEPDRIRCALAYVCGGRGLPAETVSGFDDVLLQSLLVYITFAPDGSMIYIGFDELVPSLTPLISTALSATAARPALAAGHYWPWRAQSDVCAVCIAALQDLLKINKGGQLFKASILSTEKLLQAAHGACENHVDNLLVMLVKYGIHEQMLFEDDQQIQANRTTIGEWLSLPVHHRHGTLTIFARTYYGNWRWDLIRTLAATPRTIALFPAPLRNEAQQVLAAMHYLGLIEISAESTKSPLLFWLTDSSASEGARATETSIRVLPDFSAVIAQEIDLTELYSFTNIGILRSFDRIYNGAISQKSISDALAHGTPAEVIIMLLKKWGAPANVSVSITEWVDQFNRLALFDGDAIFCADPQTARQLSALASIKDNIECIGTQTVFVVRHGQAATVSRLLAGMGFDCRMPYTKRNQPGSDIPDDDDTTGTKKTRDLLAELTEQTVTPQPIVDFVNQSKPLHHQQRGGKYSAELKALDMSELFHVIDYAIITGSQIRFEYLGSAGLKKGIHAVTPVLLVKGTDPVFEGIIHAGSGSRRYYINKIAKIGVVGA